MTAQRAQEIAHRLTAAGVTNRVWCGVVIWDCPHCYTQNENAEFMLSHVRDHFGDDGIETAEAASTIDDSTLAQLPVEEETNGTTDNYSGGGSEPLRNGASGDDSGSV